MKLLLLFAFAALLAEHPVRSQNFIAGFFSSILNNLSNIQQRTSRLSTTSPNSSSKLFTETETIVITSTETSTTTAFKEIAVTPITFTDYATITYVETVPMTSTTTATETQTQQVSVTLPASTVIETSMMTESVTLTETATMTFISTLISTYSITPIPRTLTKMSTIETTLTTEVTKTQVITSTETLTKTDRDTKTVLVTLPPLTVTETSTLAPAKELITEKVTITPSPVVVTETTTVAGQPVTITEIVRTTEVSTVKETAKPVTTQMVTTVTSIRIVTETVPAPSPVAEKPAESAALHAVVIESAPTARKLHHERSLKAAGITPASLLPYIVKRSLNIEASLSEPSTK